MAPTSQRLNSKGDKRHKRASAFGTANSWAGPRNVVRNLVYTYLSQASCTIVSGFRAALDDALRARARTRLSVCLSIVYPVVRE